MFDQLEHLPCFQKFDLDENVFCSSRTRISCFVTKFLYTVRELQQTGVEKKIKLWKESKRLGSAAGYGTVALNITKSGDSTMLLESISIGLYRQITEKAPASSRPDAKAENTIKKTRRAAARRQAVERFEEAKAQDEGKKPRMGKMNK